MTKKHATVRSSSWVLIVAVLVVLVLGSGAFYFVQKRNTNERTEGGSL